MYLDPGSWSMVFQLLIGLVLSVPLLIGIYWGRIKQRFFGSRVKREVTKD